mmetsp:Transcript_9288/g.34044  ORF Transcript_9288/g.34044 Transcript_9288/m.34044 type:complete len:486 (-) Transcript_9288:175-1632(-)
MWARCHILRVLGQSRSLEVTSGHLCASGYRPAMKSVNTSTTSTLTRASLIYRKAGAMSCLPRDTGAQNNAHDCRCTALLPTASQLPTRGALYSTRSNLSKTLDHSRIGNRLQLPLAHERKVLPNVSTLVALQFEITRPPPSTVPSESSVEQAEGNSMVLLSPRVVAASRTELCDEFGLRPRDLRAADPAFKNHLAAILSRPRAVVVSLHRIRAIIGAQKLLIFNYADPLVRSSVVPYVEGHLQERVDSTLPQVALGPDTSSVWGNPFEFDALEALLSQACDGYEERTGKFRGAVGAVLEKLQGESTPQMLLSNMGALLPFKHDLSELLEEINETGSALKELLSNDQDMVQMYLSEKLARERRQGEQRSVSDHTEVEELLEAYFMRVQDVSIQLQSLRSKIASTEEFVRVRLDSKRNALIRMDVVMSSATFSAAIGGLILSAFGMNLVTGLESSHGAFEGAVGAAVVSSVTSLCLVLTLMRGRKIL